jgi:hypothetical protein
MGNVKVDAVPVYIDEFPVNPKQAHSLPNLPYRFAVLNWLPSGGVDIACFRISAPHKPRPR